LLYIHSIPIFVLTLCHFDSELPLNTIESVNVSRSAKMQESIIRSVFLVYHEVPYPLQYNNSVFLTGLLHPLQTPIKK